MNAQSAGQVIVDRLTLSLPEGIEWDEREQVTLGLIRDAADRAAVLKVIFDAEVGKSAQSTHRITEVAAELRALEVNVVRWSASLDPKMENVKSARHVAAANKRWHPGASG